MAIDILSIQPYVIDPSLNGKIFWFYGEPATRKTSVACKFDKPLLIATERGYKFINGVKPQLIKNWNDMRTIYRQLKDPAAQEMYNTIVFDRADTLYEYCQRYICSVKGIDDLGELPFSAGYRFARKEFDSIIKGIESLGYGMIFITHDKVDMEKQTKQDLENNAAKVLRGYADFTFLLKKEIVDGNPTVIAYSQRSETDTKARPPYFAPSFEFTFENLKKELEIAIDKQVKMEGITVQVQEFVSEERSFEDIKNSVIKMYLDFKNSDHASVSDIEQVITVQMQGIRISEAPESYRDKLLIIETYMLGIE